METFIVHTNCLPNVAENGNFIYSNSLEVDTMNSAMVFCVFRCPKHYF